MHWSFLSLFHLVIKPTPPGEYYFVFYETQLKQFHVLLLTDDVWSKQDETDK